MLKIEAIMKSKFVLWAMFLFGSLVYGGLCFGKTIWLDEALTGSFIRMGWKDLIAFTATDVHPPLYYLIVKLGITLFGDHVYVVKLFSYVPFVFTLLLVATKIRKNYGEKEAFVLMALLCTTPCIIDRNAEMRMYQWALFFVFAFVIYLFESIRSKETKAWYLCAFYGLCAAYTHYYALIVVVILYGIIFFRYIMDRIIIISIIRNAIISVLGYMPWLVVFLKQAMTLKETGWWQEESLSFKDVYDYFVWPFLDNTGYEPFLFLILVFAVVIFAMKKTIINKMEILCSIGAYLLLIIVGLLIIVCYQPVFIQRFIYPTVGVLLLGLALMIAQWRTEVVCCICTVILFLGAKTYNSQLHYQFSDDSIPRLESFMDTVQEEDSVIICDQDAVKCIVEYLYPSYFVENDTEIEQPELEGKTVYYFVCDSQSTENDKLQKLGIEDCEYIEDVFVQYHSFEIYSVGVK